MVEELSDLVYPALNEGSLSLGERTRVDLNVSVDLLIKLVD